MIFRSSASWTKQVSTPDPVPHTACCDDRLGGGHVRIISGNNSVLRCGQNGQGGPGLKDVLS